MKSGRCSVVVWACFGAGDVDDLINMDERLPWRRLPEHLTAKLRNI